MTRKSIHLTLEDTSIHIIGKATKEYDLESLSKAADYIVRQWEKNRTIKASDELVDRIAERVVELIKDVKI